MNFTISKTELTRELKKIVPFVERKTTIPILANLLVVAANDAITITATDLDCSLIAVIPAHIKTAGTCTIPARKLSDTVKTLKTLDAESVTIEAIEGNWIVLICGALKVKLVGMESSRFPVMGVIPADDVITVKGDVLAGLIARTEFAISKEESRYTLNAALLAFREHEVKMVTTDGHRLAHVSHNGSYVMGATGESKTLIPTAALTHLSALVSRDDVAITKDESRVFFRSGNWTMISRMASGNFPNYEAVMPKGSTNRITMPASALSATLARISQFADERSKAVKFSLADDGLTLSASSSETGDASELLKAEYLGKPMSLGFNAGYVQDLLGTLAKDELIELRTKDPQSSGLFVPQANSEFQTSCVIMPMRV